MKCYFTVRARQCAILPQIPNARQTLHRSANPLALNGILRVLQLALLGVDISLVHLLPGGIGQASHLHTSFLCDLQRHHEKQRNRRK